MTDVSISKPSVITTGDADFAEQAPGQAGTSTLPQSIGEAPPPTSGDVNFKLAGIQVDISEKQVPMIMLAMSSSISLMAVSFGVDEDHRYYSYALSSGAVALSLSAVGLLLSWKKEWDRGSLSRYVSGMCFVWTFIAATILTFGDGPFVNTGNGYFATWAMVIFSTQSLGITAAQMKESAYDGSSLLVLGLASVVLIIGLSIELIADKTFKVNMIYSLILAMVSLVFVERLRDFDHFLKSAAVTIFAAMWMVAASLLTFDGPFTYTGNGYFAAWGAAFSCFFAANDEFLGQVSDWVDRNVVSHVKDLAGVNHDEENPAATSTSGPKTTTSSVSPYVEDTSTAETFQLSIDLPGISMDDIDISLDGNKLTISGTRNADDAMSARTMTKSFDIDPYTVDISQLDAKLANGVLVVSAPKKAKEVKKIVIGGGE